MGETLDALLTARREVAEKHRAEGRDDLADETLAGKWDDSFGITQRLPRIQAQAGKPA